MAGTIEPDYKNAQKDLYSGCRLAVTNYLANQVGLATYKALYTVLWGTTLQTEIEAAENLPDDDARNEAAVTYRIDLVKAGNLCREKFGLLKGYIRTAYGEEYWDAKFTAAGQGYYDDAVQEDWESVEALNTSAIAFITANSAALTAGMNMPAGFTATYTGAISTFDSVYANFKAAEETGVATDAKIAANNAIYKKVKNMLADAQEFYKKDGAIRSLFVWANLMNQINPKVSGIKGNVKDLVTSMPLTGSVVAKKAGEPEKVTLINDGKYSMVLSDGEFALTIKADGKPEVHESVSIEGTMRTKNFEI